MNVILTSLEPFQNDTLNSGTIKVEELSIWPGWTEHPDTNLLAEYSWKNSPDVIRTIELDPGVNTFREISHKFNRIINAGASNVIGAIAGLAYKDHRVNLFIKPGTQLASLRIADYIAEKFKIKPDSSNLGNPVDIDSIMFYNAKNLHFTCVQANDQCYLNSRESPTLLTSAAVDGEKKIITFSPSPEIRFTSNRGQLAFNLQNDKGDELPIKRLFCRLTINDERLRRENLPTDTCNSADRY